MPPVINSRHPTSNSDWSQAPFEDHLRTKTFASDTSPTSHPQPDPRFAVNNSSPALQGLKASTSPETYNSLQPPNAASPAFSFDDYLTPEFSSENPQSEHSHHTTPSADDVWQDPYQTNLQIASHEVHPLDNDNQNHDTYFLSSAHNAFGSSQLVNSARSSGEKLIVNHPALLTPEMSTASMTPERNVRAPFSSIAATNHLGPDFDGQNFEHVHHINTKVASSPSQKRKADGDDQQYAPHTVSPVVMVSTYNRGDSPARSQVPLSRSNSRRSQASQLGQQATVNPVQDLANLSSRLMPPTHPEHDPWAGDDDDDDDNDDGGYQRTGLAPTNRNTALIPSVNDLVRQRELDEKSADVEHWLATSNAGSPADSDDESRAIHNRRNRIRSRSTGARTDATGLQIFSDSHIPGPGILIDEESTYYYSDDAEDDSSMLSGAHDAEGIAESPPAEVDPNEPTRVDGYFPLMDDNIAPEDDDPLPRQFIARTPWQDRPRGPPAHDQGQPPTANAAMYIFSERAAVFETASRAATWGTGRRLSDSDITSVLDGTMMTRHMSLKDSIAERARARGSSIINSARKVLPGRSGSFIKKHQKQASQQASPDEKVAQVASPEPQEEHNKHRDSVSSIRQTAVRRLSSRGKSKPPKSPPHSTTSALLAMTGQLTAMGGSSVHLSAEPEPSRSPLFGSLKRVRSRSEVSKSPKATHGLSELITKHGGPPMPMLASSPLQMREPSPRASVGHDDDADDDGLDDSTGVKMDFSSRAHNILPTLEGFKTHARQLNPRLEPFLIERIGQDQLKRFKRLVKNKVDHTRAVQLGKCSSGHQCLSQGGKATILPPRNSGKDAPSNVAQFKVATGGGDSDNDESGFVEGVVTPALFPAGIPLPPTTHLPAEFECPLCFQVKKFQKPSDWTKHVHEDVQPFSCTFANCPEPKSFKRKADWVRHENERHRHLEWWKCSVQECAHVCYRKDNFVQHLVREHKMAEPKGKGSKSGTTRVRSASRSTQSSQVHNDFWSLVDACRKETSLMPKSEPCKFCGNVCNTWKKLSVHVGKHMEQIAMPVLNLADCQKVNAETVISPIEAPPPPSLPMASIESKSLGAPGASEHFHHSPYTSSVHSNYQSSSAGHSPALPPTHPQLLPTGMNVEGSVYYSPHVEASGMPSVMVSDDRFQANQTHNLHYPYDAYENMASSEYLGSHPHHAYGTAMDQNMATSYPSQHLPRALPLGTPYDAVPGLQQNMRSIAYEQPPQQPSQQPPAPPPSQQHASVAYYGVNPATSGAYVNSYGPSLAHQSEAMSTSQPSHTTHGHVPNSTSHTDNHLGYYTTPQSGSSQQGYY